MHGIRADGKQTLEISAEIAERHGCVGNQGGSRSSRDGTVVGEW